MCAKAPGLAEWAKRTVRLTRVSAKRSLERLYLNQVEKSFGRLPARFNPRSKRGGDAVSGNMVNVSLPPSLRPEPPEAFLMTFLIGV